MREFKVGDRVISRMMGSGKVIATNDYCCLARFGDTEQYYYPN